MSDAEVLLMKSITKRYPGVLALDKVDFDLRRGEVHALVGENGAGKSTLMKILSGAVPCDEGQIVVEGKDVAGYTPHQAQRLGIAMIYQEFNLCPYLNVAENIFLGREPSLGRSPFIDRNRLYDSAENIVSRIGVDLAVRRQVSTLSVAEQQMVEIAKALSMDSRIIVMDEPSATLTERELEALFGQIAVLKSEGIGIIYISHRMEELFEVGDRVTVLRDGYKIGTRNVRDVTRDEVISMMVGRELKEEFPKRKFDRGEEILRVENVNRNGTLHGINLSLHRGELVGITGLVGAGRTELARVIFGADRPDGGLIYLYGKRVEVKSPRVAINLGIGLLTEDRKNQGLVLGMTLRENVTLANLSELVKGIFINRSRERHEAKRSVGSLRIRAHSIEQAVKNLSGGNQQKVVLAKWLFTKSKVLIFDEPTRGIDVGAKVEIYNLMNDLVERGVGVIMISSELPEVLGMCDRIVVMHEGRIAGELTQEQATQERIMNLATGGN